MVVGEGASHESRCGVASFVGVELAKPTIGVAKQMEDEKLEGDSFSVDGELLGRLVSTKEHARPVFVSVGNNVNVEQAADFVKKIIVPPHKMPEPLHVARKVAKRVMQEARLSKKSKGVCHAEL